MKSIKQQYIDLREGNMSQANFMRNLRMTLPQYVTNVTSFDDSVKILRNKGILTEADITMSKDTLDKIKKVIGDITANNDEYHRDGYTMGFFEGVDPDSEESDDYDDYDADYEEPNEPFDMAEAKYNTYADVVNAISKKYSYKVYHDEIEEFMKDKASLEAIMAGKDPIAAYEEFYNIQRESINEAKDSSSEGKWKTVTGKDLYAHFKEIDNLNGQEVLIGIDFEMQKNQDLTKLEAQKIVIKNLKKNPIYYTAEDMSGVEGYEPEYMGGKSANPEAHQMQYLDKNMGNVVDKKRGMQPVKGVEKAKKDSDKGGETNKTEKGVSLMSLIAKSVRGVQKMDATGEKMKKITVKEGMGEYTFNGNLRSDELSKLKHMLPDAEIDIDEEPGQTLKTTVSSAKYNDKSVKHAVQSVLGMLEPIKDKRDLGGSFDKFKDQLKEMIRKELRETFDGMEPMVRTGLDESKLSPEEQKIADDILNTLDEGMFGDVLDKIKSYAKKGLLTIGIIGALLSAPNFSQAQKQQIKQVADTEMSSTQEKGGKEWEQIKKAVSSTSPKFINVKGDQEMGIKPFQSLNWGAHKSAGSSAGISISYEKGSGVIDIEVTHVVGKDKKGYDQIIKNLQNMGVKDKYSVQSENGFSGQISVSKANDVINFVNNNLSLLKENNIDSAVNEALKKFRKGN